MQLIYNDQSVVVDYISGRLVRENGCYGFFILLRRRVVCYKRRKKTVIGSVIQWLCLSVNNNKMYSNAGWGFFAMNSRGAVAIGTRI
jgi:hypothetical protein